MPKMHLSTTQTTPSHKREECFSQSSTQSSMRNHAQNSCPYSAPTSSLSNTTNETTVANSASIPTPYTPLEDENEITTSPESTTNPDKHNDIPNFKCRCILCCHIKEWKAYKYDIHVLLKFATKFLIKTTPLPLCLPLLRAAEQKVSNLTSSPPSPSHPLNQAHQSLTNILQKLPLGPLKKHYTHLHERKRTLQVDTYIFHSLQVKNPRLARRCLRLAREEYDDLWEENTGLETSGEKGALWM